MTDSKNKPRVGFIGLGNMGQSMAGHILQAGYPLRVYNRSRDKAQALLARGLDPTLPAMKAIGVPEITAMLVGEIDAEPNAEIRRVMIERYGTARYVRDSGAVEVDRWTDEAGQPVRLLRRDVPGDEAIVMLHLVNSTVDPDGKRREYWRRVPPTQMSAWEARNWTCQLPVGALFSVRS